MKYNGLFLVPKPGESKPMEHEAQPQKADPPRSEEYVEGFRDGFQTGWRKRFEYETSSTRR